MANTPQITDPWPTWSANATSYLRPRLQEFGERMAEGAQGMPGNWNPFGFAKFFAGEVPGLGDLIVHVWPAGRRGGIAGTPPLHNHSFDMVSGVVAGTYADRIYTPQSSGATRTNERGNETPEFAKDATGRLYPRFVTGAQFGIEIEDGDASFQPTGDWVTLQGSRRSRQLQPGAVHRMPADIYHVTEIPLNRLAMTVLLRRDVEGVKDLMVGRPSYAPVSLARREVTPDERQLMADQIGEAIGNIDLSRSAPIVRQPLGIG